MNNDPLITIVRQHDDIIRSMREEIDMLRKRIAELEQIVVGPLDVHPEEANKGNYGR